MQGMQAAMYARSRVCKKLHARSHVCKKLHARGLVCKKLHARSPIRMESICKELHTRYYVCMKLHIQRVAYTGSCMQEIAYTRSFMQGVAHTRSCMQRTHARAHARSCMHDRNRVCNKFHMQGIANASSSIICKESHMQGVQCARSLRRTRKYDEVDAPDDAPDPADEQEGDGEELHRAHHDVDAQRGPRAVLAARQARLAAAQHQQPAQHRTCGQHVNGDPRIAHFSLHYI